MNDIILWIYAFCIAIFLSGMVLIPLLGLCSIVLVPLFGLCYTFMKIKMTEIRDKVGH